MADIDDGGPAFPREEYQSLSRRGQQGMSLRDWFAGQALDLIPFEGTWAEMTEKDHAALMARRAYLVADAMIATRSQQEGE